MIDCIELENVMEISVKYSLKLQYAIRQINSVQHVFRELDIVDEMDFLMKSFMPDIL